MQYRKFGRLNWKVSALGFGTMRLPVINNDSHKIDEREAIRMTRYAIDNGVNYVDTAYTYHGGNSEILVGKALKDGYRDRVRIATKLPVWSVESHKDMSEKLNEQLRKLDTDHIDFYLLHSMNLSYWKKMKKIDVFSWLEKEKGAGKISYIGFSFHDDFSIFKEMIDYYKWDFCQIQYNYVDTEYQAGRKGLLYAAERGLGVVIMEPLRGGALANLPLRVMKVLEDSGIKRSAVDWALSWLWNQPEVSVVLSGMSTFEQVEENIEIAKKGGINSFNEFELKVIEEASKSFFSALPIGCTGCEYCLPCTSDIEIPYIFQIYNQGEMFHKMEDARRRYKGLNIKADACTECGTCASRCPQNLSVPELLKKVHNELHEH